MDEQHSIPRIIWILWFQGLSEAPFVVRKCIDSWKKENPTWDVIILDSDSLGKYIMLNLPEEKIASLSPAAHSDLVRLALLSEYGGVWADATTFCMKPLDEWIDDYNTSGFFVFYKPGRDRILSNWFIAAERGCPIVSKLYEKLNSFWIKNKFDKPTRLQRKIITLLSRILYRNEKTIKYWLTPLVTKVFRVYPYFVFHYLFERLVSVDPESKIIWENTKKMSANGPHILQRIGLLSPINDASKKQIDDNHTPMYKMTWGYDHSKYLPSSLLYYLIQGRACEKTKQSAALE